MADRLRVRCRPGCQTWTQPLAPVLFDIVGLRFVGRGETRQVIPRDFRVTMVTQIILTVQQHKTHEPVVPQVPRAFDDIKLAEGMPDVLAGGPVEGETGV